MKRIYLEPYSQTEKLTVYTIRFENSSVNETDKFIKKHLELGFLEDIQIIKRWLFNLEKRGALHHYFRFENRASAGPRQTSNLRIYCIRCHNNMIILDGRGVKEGKLAQDGKDTAKSFDLINAIDFCLVEKIKTSEIFYSNDYMNLERDLFIDLQET